MSWNVEFAEIGRAVMLERRFEIDITYYAMRRNRKVRELYGTTRPMPALIDEHQCHPAIQACTDAYAELENNGRDPETLDRIVCAQLDA